MAKRHRAFAAFGAILFLITSSALTIMVVWSLAGSSSSNDASDTSTDATKTSTDTSSTSSADSTGSKLTGFTPVASVPALKETDLKVGTGATVTSSNTITVDYTGALAASGVIFQSTNVSGGQPATLALNQVITGWAEGIPGMKVGGTRQLLIPANLGYGANPPADSGIPKNAPLVFNVTVEKIDK